MRLTGLAMLLVATVFSIITLPPLSVFPSTLVLRPYAHVVLICQAALMLTLAVWNSWRSHSSDARMLTSTLLVSWAFGVYDWARLSHVRDMESYYLTPYAAMLLFGVFVIIMFRRYAGALGEVESVNAGLAQRLQSREAELDYSYERLRKIELRQTLSQERQRLTQDMHDGLGLSLVSALRVVEGGRLSEADVAEVLKGCIDDLKLAIDSMEPVEADLLLLLATFRFRLGPRLDSAGVNLHWEVTDVPPLAWLDPRNALHILRILQESFANILKHTSATEIRVATAVAGEGVEVIIEDNGQGFDVEQALAAKTGKGLQNKLRRAQAIQGQVSWTSGSGGTRFTLWLPLQRNVLVTPQGVVAQSPAVSKD